MRWIEKCLKSCGGYNVIVVDNCSQDDTVGFVTQHFPKVKTIQLKENVGFGRANNIGIERLLLEGYDYAFLLNQDAYLDKETIEKLISYHLSHPTYGILSPIHFNGDGTALDRNFSFYLGFDKNPKIYLDAIQRKLKEVYEVPFVNAAAWLIPRSTLEEVGGFDPLFFMYGEDDNYCQRLRYHGFKLGVVTEAFVRHDRDGRAKTTPEMFSKRYYDLRRKYFLHQLGNINAADVENRYAAMRTSLRIKIRKASLKLELKKVSGLKKELSMLEDLYKNILVHRNMAMKKGPTFLSQLKT